jgi:hypothetical protein
MTKAVVTYCDHYGEPITSTVEVFDIQVKEGLVAFLDDDENLTLMVQAARLISVVPVAEAEVG